ncbi:MAG: hypothetical protein LPK38_01755 [Actinomycetes bacterium]|nr:hypothetical protein [Actinomycetes bacterium]MDX5449744.1 hypothetical protein [Actinomycetes bacterium]
MRLTRPQLFAGPGGTWVEVPAGTECRYATVDELAALPAGSRSAKLTRGGYVWCWLAGAARRVPQEALSTWAPLRAPQGGRAYQRPGHDDVTPLGPA